jgi:hypothetical protein
MSGKNIFLAPDNKPVYGRVMNEYGEPLEGVKVQAGSMITSTDDDGKFHIHPVACDRIIKFFHAGDSAICHLGKAKDITVRMRTLITAHIN